MPDASNTVSLRPLVEGPSAWRGAELSRQPEKWLYRLSPREIAELQSATAAAIATGKPMLEITRADFPLPTFGARIEALRQELLHGIGFQVLRGYPMAGRPIGENAMVFWGIGRHLGNPVSQNIRGHMLGHVRDAGKVAAIDPNVRASQSTERQFFHTDTCDVVGLLCLQTAKKGGESSVVSSMTVYNEMVKRRPDLAARLFEPVAFDRRGEIRDGEEGWYEIPVFNDHEGLLSVSFSGRSVNSSSRFPGALRNPQEAIDLFSSIAEEQDLRLNMWLEVGDIQWVHNYTILHDRTAYEDWPEPERKRHLLRLWISAFGARPLSPAWITRFGSIEVGNRGGVTNRNTILKTPMADD